MTRGLRQRPQARRRRTASTGPSRQRRLPAGDAVWATLETRHPQHGPATFTVYAMDDGNRHYAISVRGPGDGSALWLAVAKELAESFDINDEISVQ